MTIVATRKDDRVMLFIDLRNVMRGADQVTSMAIDHVRLDLFRMAQILAGPRLVVAAYVFDGGSAEDDSARGLHDKLSYMGFRMVVRGGNGQDGPGERREQKEVDVALATELVAHALRDNYDTAIVVSGDRDFVPAIQQAQAAGKRVEAAAFNSNVSGTVKRVVDSFTELDELPIMEMFSPEKEPESGDDGEKKEEAKA